MLKAEDKNMKSSTRDQLEGQVDQVKGTIRDKIGQATNNPTLSVKGQAQNFRGRIQEKAGQIKKVLGS
jgi:uncharacterized protein YjbJ (UPF0337 family)